MNLVFLTLKLTSIHGGYSQLHHRLPPCEDCVTGIVHLEPLINIPAHQGEVDGISKIIHAKHCLLSLKLQICFAIAKILDVFSSPLQNYSLRTTRKTVLIVIS